MIKKRRINEFLPEFETSNNKKYEIKTIPNHTIYVKKADGHILGLYYLVLWKDCPKEKNTWEPFLAVIHF